MLGRTVEIFTLVGDGNQQNDQITNLVEKQYNIIKKLELL